MPVLTALVFTVALAAAVHQPLSDASARELMLAGGALAICSDLSPRACREARVGGRQAARYRLDEAGMARAVDPALWHAGRGPGVAALALMLDAARESLAGHAGTAEGVDVATLEAALEGVCLAANCAESDPRRPWSQLLDVERSAILSALEIPQRASARERVREGAAPALSQAEGGVQVLREFVAAAARRTSGRPRIAVVTASAHDPMDPVDFYRSAFRALGAEAAWWPVDAAVAAARFEVRDCAALPRLRRERLQLSQRERIYPDLAVEQTAFCLTEAPMLADVHAVFFAGGDQWRLRRAFVDAGDAPNPWLVELREAHAAGRLVVGGTSAGAAVQSGSWMLGNGSVAAALAQPVSTAPPPEPGCARGNRCGAVDAEQLSLWPAGGLGLAEGAIVDTHFSERARELRLLLAMQAADARWAYGADETSALHLREADGRREIRAIGAQGGWVFHRPTGEDAREGVMAWYLVPGASLRIEGDKVSLQRDAGAERARQPADAVPASALDPGALRAAAQQLAWRCARGLKLTAGTRRAELRCLKGAQSWRSTTGGQGVGPLQLRLLGE
ncbi:MAG: hypothetical protein MUE46_18735 [Xanthomonadales bacterium]|jgi:cyanophycinase-like exopeptidase|nr:hypothetical protein [Xanthomonadales bacterium]